MAVEINVPTLGESVTEATVAKWFKAEGDAVAVDEALVELETDKVTVEVNAPVAGALKSIAAAEGAEVLIDWMTTHAREQGLDLTTLEQAVMWANAGIDRRS